MGWFKLWLHPSDRRVRGPVVKSTARRSLGVGCLALVCAVLVSCGEPGPAPAPDPSPWVPSHSPGVAAATPVGAAVKPRIGTVIWTTATDPATNAPVEPVASYGADAPRIIAAVQSQALPAGAIVEATWEYNGTSLDAFATRLTATDSGAEQWLSFHIARDPNVPWPVGTYAVTISLDGTAVQQGSIEVSEAS